MISERGEGGGREGGRREGGGREGGGREGGTGSGSVRAKTTSLDAYSFNQKKIKVIVKKKNIYFPETNKKSQVYYFKQPLKLVNTDMIETISWIAEKNLESAAIISHLKLFA